MAKSLKPVKVGIIGCGNISSAYIKGMQRFPILQIIRTADLVQERAKAQAEAFGIPKFGTTEELLADKDIELVVNLTVPKAHADINKKILAAGKHLHVEKPWAISLKDGKEVVKTAKTKKLLCGCAPDTFMGGGLQSTRYYIEKGFIGKPVSATAFMMCPGHESWHPSPEFYYEVGGGPLFDMGPYYLTAMVSLIGTIKSVTAMANVTFPTRLITSQPKNGTVVKVETPTHITASLEFDNGALGTMIMSFDVQSHRLPCLEIYGTEGTISAPDPNTFGGPIRWQSKSMTQSTEMKIPHGYTENMRGIGPADMGYAIRTGRKHRASGELGCHVLEVMAGALESAKTGKRVDIASADVRPAPLPLGLVAGMLD